MSTAHPERDRVAVVSGAGTGIGQAIATRFGALGWQVGIGGRRVEKLDETKSLVEDAGGTAVAHALDVTDPDSVEHFFTAVEQQAGPVTVVINNAATPRYGPLHDFVPEEINAEISTKLTGSLYMARRGIISMQHRGRPGDILFITSTSAAEPWPYHLPYGAASAGAEHAARILGLELEGSGIRVTTLRVSNTAGTDFATRELGTERMDAANRLWFRHARLSPRGPLDPGDGRGRGGERRDPASHAAVRRAVGGAAGASWVAAGDVRGVRRRDDPPVPPGVHGAAMKAVRAAGDGVIVDDLDEPPGGGELLDMQSTSVCASDLMYIGFGSRKILGHELAGIREDGTPVVVEALYGCMECEQCRRGTYNLCPTHAERALGVTADGGMAEQFRAPPERLVPLPPGLDVRDASIVEPASVSWHALRLADTGPDTRVAVVGAGRARPACGRRRPSAWAPRTSHSKRDTPTSVRPASASGRSIGTDGLYDVVVEAAGSTESLDRAIDLVAPRGTIVVLGVHLGTVEVRLDAAVPPRGEPHPVTRLLPRTTTAARWRTSRAMLADDPEIAATLITHRFPIEDADEAFRVAADKTSGAIRVVIEP